MDRLACLLQGVYGQLSVAGAIPETGSLFSLDFGLNVVYVYSLTRVQQLGPDLQILFR